VDGLVAVGVFMGILPLHVSANAVIHAFILEAPFPE
jgi:hypothetical protein